MRRHSNKQKALDDVLWLNFEFRTSGDSFGAVKSKDDYLVTNKKHRSLSNRTFEVLPKDYSNMDYEHIQQIASDEDPLLHWEEIRGMFSVLDGEILRYILHVKIPLEKFIRHELASRGFDKDHKWCGFEKAEEIWLK